MLCVLLWCIWILAQAWPTLRTTSPVFCSPAPRLAQVLPFRVFLSPPSCPSGKPLPWLERAPGQIWEVPEKDWQGSWRRWGPWQALTLMGLCSWWLTTMMEMVMLEEEEWAFYWPSVDPWLQKYHSSFSQFSVAPLCASLKHLLKRNHSHIGYTYIIRRLQNIILTFDQLNLLSLSEDW